MRQNCLLVLGLVLLSSLIGLGCDEEKKSFALELSLACLAGDDASVKQYLEDGTNANGEEGFEGSPMMAALRGGHTSIAEILVEYGADINVVMNDDKTILESLIDEQDAVSSEENKKSFQDGIDWLKENDAKETAE